MRKCARCDRDAVVTRSGKPSPYCAPCGREKTKNWRLAHPQENQEMQRRSYLAHAAERRSKSRERTRLWRALNPERARAATEEWRRSHGPNPEYWRRWYAKHPNVELERTRARRRRRAGILLAVRVSSDLCGICQEPLTARRFPDPLSTTIGHEPPLAVAAREGWRVITERPEHWACNRRKSDHLDMEMEAA